MGGTRAAQEKLSSLKLEHEKNLIVNKAKKDLFEAQIELEKLRLKKTKEGYEDVDLEEDVKQKIIIVRILEEALELSISSAATTSQSTQVTSGGGNSTISSNSAPSLTSPMSEVEANLRKISEKLQELESKKAEVEKNLKILLDESQSEIEKLNLEQKKAEEEEAKAAEAAEAAERNVSASNQSFSKDDSREVYLKLYDAQKKQAEVEAETILKKGITEQKEKLLRETLNLIEAEVTLEKARLKKTQDEKEDSEIEVETKDEIKAVEKAKEVLRLNEEVGDLQNKKSEVEKNITILDATSRFEIKKLELERGEKAKEKEAVALAESSPFSQPNSKIQKVDQELLILERQIELKEELLELKKKYFVIDLELIELKLELKNLILSKEDIEEPEDKKTLDPAINQLKEKIEKIELNSQGIKNETKKKKIK